MKNNKRMTALLAAATVIVGGIAVSFADEPAAVPTTTIVMTTDASITSNNFAAYRLLNVTTTKDKEGQDVYKYSVNDKYRTLLTTLTGENTDSGIITAISKLSGEDIRKFADDFYAQNTAQPDSTTTSSQFADVPQGYYLIVETSTSGDNDTISLVMLDTAAKETVEIKTKEDIPSTEKKTKDVNDSTGEATDWQDSSDYDIGDSVPFKFTAHLPSNYDAYETYKLEFHDTESTGLTFNADSVVVKVNGTAVDPSMYTIDTNVQDETFVIRIADAKQIATSKDDVITVEYTSTLNEDAVIGQPGNPNKMYITYSNNPYDEGEGKSPEDIVVVFTYQTIVNKVDGAGDPLAGAGFTLYKFDSVTNEYLPVSDEISGEDITTFQFKGIDDGIYKLVETTVPSGYNQAADIEFTVLADHDVESADPKLNTISITPESAFVIDVPQGSLTIDIENLTGAELPSTGGIGTTIFYIIGGVLVLTGGVLFITRKKVDKDEK